MSSRHSCSRSGYLPVRAISSATTSLWRPCSTSMSSQVSSAASRSSSSRGPSDPASGPGRPASAAPCQPSSAARSSSAAADGSPAARSVLASETRRSNTARSRQSSGRWIRYPSPTDTTVRRAPAVSPSASITLRSRDTYVRRTDTAAAGCSSPQTASRSSVRATACPRRSSSAARTARCCGEPRSSSCSPRQARTGPRTAKRTEAS